MFPYTGLDRFDRVIDVNWFQGSGGNRMTLDRYQYGYDADSNRVFRNNLVFDSFGELYHVYDNLNRLTDWRRGTLVRLGNSPIFTQATNVNRFKLFSYDAQGNWKSLVQSYNNDRDDPRSQSQDASYTAQKTEQWAGSGWESPPTPPTDPDVPN